MLIRSQSSAANEAQHFGKQFPFSRARREGKKRGYRIKKYLSIDNKMLYLLAVVWHSKVNRECLLNSNLKAEFELF